MKKSLLSVLALSAASALTLAGCAAPPSATTSPAATGSASASAPETSAPAETDFTACMVSDAGGFDDKSFNEAGFRGLQKAKEELGIQVTTTESKNANDYANNLDGLVADGCNLIISVGFMLSAPTITLAKNSPDVHFAIIDDRADNEPEGNPDGKADSDNIKPMVFDTAGAAFLGGYAAASYSKTGKVGTFGGGNIPPVTIFMDGFAKGVAYYNEQKGTDVQVLGWDVAKQDGLFTGEFTANDTAKVMAQGLIDQGADVLLPVGGPIYQSAAQAIRDSGGDLTLLGVDSDVAISDPSVSDLVLVSIQKGIEVAVHEAVASAVSGSYDTSLYVGTLENGGVLLGEFHDFDSKIDPALKGELDAVKAGIIDGSIDASSVSSP